jgi:hypothetical protein
MSFIVSEMQPRRLYSMDSSVRRPASIFEKSSTSSMMASSESAAERTVSR